MLKTNWTHIKYKTQAELNRFGLRFIWYTRQESNL